MDFTLEYLCALEDGDMGKAEAMLAEAIAHNERVAKAARMREYNMRKWGQPTPPPVDMR